MSVPSQDWLAEVGARLGASAQAASAPLLALSHDIHSRPETRFEETFASAALRDYLAGAGFDVVSAENDPTLAGLPTAFRAEKSIGEGGPTIALFCEYDALPAIGHACGHNIIGTAGAGAAVLATEWLAANGGNGRVVVLGSPGEEGGGGKVLLADAGALAGVDAALMVHPGGYDAVRRNNLGRSAWEATFSGRAAHASSAPDRGVNALDASTLFLVAIGLLRQQLRQDARVHANVIEGGDAINVIPERSVVRFYLRSTDSDYLRGRLYEAVRDCALGAALATGCEVSVDEVAPAYDPVDANPVLAQLAADSFTAIGRPLEVTSNVEGGAGSTDMGNVSQLVPALHPYVCVRAGVPTHTREFAEAAGSPEGDRAVLDGAAMLATMTVALIAHPELVESAAAAFAQGRNGR
jgi:amidohydrolase